APRRGPVARPPGFVGGGAVGGAFGVGGPPPAPAGGSPPPVPPDPPAVQHSPPTNRTPGCDRPGSLTVALLPSLDRGRTGMTLNPCLPFADLLAAVADLVPEGGQEGRGKISAFTGGLRSLIKRIDEADTTLRCGYETDRLAIALYQDRAFRWSVGAVAVIRGRFRAILDVSICVLVNQLPFAVPLTVGPDR